MNGAESLVRTLVNAGVEVCFTNPGTSEMHFVAALDRVPGMRCVLGLFEGVVTGAADGYARMKDKPASTLLHLGPGLGNGLANLHNARKAQTPVVNIVGDHATYHVEHDAPLTADVEGIAWPVSAWVRTSRDARSVAADGAEAVAAAWTRPGQVATLILPADTAWEHSDGPAGMPAIPEPPRVAEDRIKSVAAVLRSGEPTVILMAGRVLRADGLAISGAIAAATGARVIGQMSNARLERGAGRFTIDRVPYPVDQALAMLEGVKNIVLVGAKAPVAFFGYPDKPSRLWPQDCAVHTLAEPREDMLHALEWLAEELSAPRDGALLQSPALPPLPADGPLDIDSIACAVGALLPENAIVADEAIGSGRGLHPYTLGSPPHDWLQICGGAIGLGVPMATGAAVACPHRKVIGLQADGSAMYTLQGLWTQAREGLDVTTVLFANRAYASLKHELFNVGARNPGRKALDMLEIGRPDLDWVSLARGMGVEAGRATSNAEFIRELRAGLASEGPYLIEAVI
ncbi:MAG: acetolactate synthase large subunit [Proteobacteria bacterium]|jgi:acetolactate synthase-1/2/3 large subunit|nr:acetolactate synthase large subunit [Pseudomonadota bacterium]